jgi:ubiquinone/menaquinone biosynthesis C-methylase UbiE
MPPYDIGDARKLPYGDGEFDHVFASNLLEHFQDTTAILTEWARVLRLDGFLELVVPDAMGILYDHFSGKDKWGVTQERLLGSRSYEGNQHYRAFTVSTFSEVIAQVPLLNFSWAVSCYDGGGIHSLAVKRPVL